MISAGHLEPLVWEDGTGNTLLGTAMLDDDTRIWVLSEPGVIDNAGLRDRANLHFAVGLLDTIRRGGPVVFDETMHGFEETPSLWKALFRFPLALVTLHVTLLVVVVVWAGLGRFGPAKSAQPIRPRAKPTTNVVQAMERVMSGVMLRPLREP